VTLFGETDTNRAERLRLLEEKEPLEYVDGTGDDFGKVLRELDQDETPTEKISRDQDDSVPTKKEEEEVFGSNLIAKEAFVLRVLKKTIKEWNLELEERSEFQKKDLLKEK